MSFTIVTVTGTIFGPDGNPAGLTGLEFKLSQVLVNFDTGEQYDSGLIEVPTDENGNFTVDLVATQSSTGKLAPSNAIWFCNLYMLDTYLKTNVSNPCSFTLPDSNPFVDIVTLI